MLATADSKAYWLAPKTDGDALRRARVAFDGHWFGTKSEARVRTLLGDMALRFDAYPSALAALRAWRPDAHLLPWLCHFHTQLADPIYRQFTGGYLPDRMALGYSTVDRDGVARWIRDTWPDRWSAATRIKFGSNLLAASHDAGLFAERKDPRRLMPPRVPRLAFEYLLYLLREVDIAGGLVESPYVRAVAPTEGARSDLFRDLRSVRLASLGDVQNLTYSYPSLEAWVHAQREAA